MPQVLFTDGCQYSFQVLCCVLLSLLKFALGVGGDHMDTFERLWGVVVRALLS